MEPSSVRSILSIVGKEESAIHAADAHPLTPGVRARLVAEDAVSCELVSAPNSLLTGKLTGNFAEPPPALIGARIQWLAAEFPTQRNREFPNVYQGKLFKEQGTGTPDIKAPQCVDLNRALKHARRVGRCPRG